MINLCFERNGNTISSILQLQKFIWLWPLSSECEATQSKEISVENAVPDSLESFNYPAILHTVNALGTVELTHVHK